MGNREQIISEAESLLSRHILDELKDWYDYTLQDCWQYVVFTVRRSYMVALIMETITDKEMKTRSSVFLTDAALFLRCGELADTYRKYGHFPKILICDDIMIHGRSMNHIIDGLEEELYRLLSDECEKDTIASALVKAIEIHVYTRTWDSLLLKGAYVWKLHYMRKESPKFWRQVSSDLSSLILQSDITNACYIYTEHLSDAQMDEMKDALIGEEGFIRTIYQRIQQYVKLSYLGSDSEVKAVLALRIIKNDYQEGYRIAPFAFLPNMTAEETDMIADFIAGKLPKKYQKWFMGLREIYGKRAFSEIITLLFSDAILKSFKKDYGIIADPEEKKRELVKLARNYCQCSLEQTVQMLEELIGMEQESLLSLDEIGRAMELIHPGERMMMQLETGKTLEITLERRQEIRDKVEDYFYEQGRIDEEAAYQLMKLPYCLPNAQAKRRARGCCFTLRELNQGYTREESQYCMAYLLQMIDAGIGSLSSYAPNDVKVYGYAQFTKAGEQSLLIRPLRMYRYIPLLSRIQYECERRLRDLTEEIQEFGAAMGWEQTRIDKLTAFIGGLNRMGHTPRDWNGNYVRKIDASSKSLFDLIHSQSDLRQAYVEYADEKYKYRVRV